MAKKSLPTTASAMPEGNPRHEAQERKWRAESALQDIERAEKHRSDKSLMKDVKACAKERMKTMSKITGK